MHQVTSMRELVVKKGRRLWLRRDVYRQEGQDSFALLARSGVPVGQATYERLKRETEIRRLYIREENAPAPDA